MKRKAAEAGITGKPANKKKVKLSKPLAQQSNTVRGGPEKKNIDITQVLALPIAGIGVLSNQLTPLPQGTGSGNRLGRKTRALKLHLRYQYSLAATSAGGSPCRFKVVYDKQANNAALAIGTVMATDTFTGFNNLDEADRFITIVDSQTEEISTQNNFSSCGAVNRKIDLETLWLGGSATGTINDIVTGSFFLMAWQNGGITVAAPTFTYNCRIRFEDN